MAIILDMAEYKVKKEIEHDQEELEILWDVFKETKETIYLLPKFMVIKLLSACRKRLAE